MWEHFRDVSYIFQDVTGEKVDVGRVLGFLYQILDPGVEAMGVGEGDQTHWVSPFGNYLRFGEVKTTWLRQVGNFRLRRKLHPSVSPSGCQLPLTGEP
ncbi:MAG: hypothetical protein LIO72_02700 [Ruminococcus sp.]|nr:hypothetical protein [Ruminococcus sp.]